MTRESGATQLLLSDARAMLERESRLAQSAHLELALAAWLTPNWSAAEPAT